MTRSAVPHELTLAATQPPVSWYSDPRIHELEQEWLFRPGPRYLGHAGMVPQAGDYQTLAWLDHARMLVRNEDGIELMSNICRHRQAIMLEGRGNARHIACPVHRWAYDRKGRLLGAPRFPDNPCLHLDKHAVKNWRGLLFDGPRDPSADLAGVGFAEELERADWRLGRVVIDEYPVNWKTFVEVYLEDYHVAPFHPGLSHFVDLGELKWTFGAQWSVQTVGISQQLQKPGSPVYERWHRAVLGRDGERLPRHGGIWLMVYPNIMVEWYPHALVVSIAIPRSPTRTTNLLEFYYPESILREAPDFADAEREAYLETAREDDEICRRIERGRRALLAEGRAEAGPYQSPMEDGMQHFHEYLQRELAPHI